MILKKALIFRGAEGHCKKLKGNCRKPPCNTVPASSSSLPKSSGFASHKPNPTNLASDRAVLKGKSDSQHKKKVRRGERRKTKQCIDSRTCKFLYISINGYKSKADSIQQLIEEKELILYY